MRHFHTIVCLALVLAACSEEPDAPPSAAPSKPAGDFGAQGGNLESPSNNSCENVPQQYVGIGDGCDCPAGGDRGCDSDCDTGKPGGQFCGCDYCYFGPESADGGSAEPQPETSPSSDPSTSTDTGPITDVSTGIDADASADAGASPDVAPSTDTTDATSTDVTTTTDVGTTADAGAGTDVTTTPPVATTTEAIGDTSADAGTGTTDGADDSTSEPADTTESTDPDESSEEDGNDGDDDVQIVSCEEIPEKNRGANDGCDCDMFGDIGCDIDCFNQGNSEDVGWCGCDYCHPDLAAAP